jgi:hypothetical protein
VEREHRFCPWCAAPQRLKVVDFFRAHPGIEADRGRALRVSRYLGEERHTRFSVWDESAEGPRAAAAVSLDDAEAARLARFLEDTEPTLTGIEAPADSTIH